MRSNRLLYRLGDSRNHEKIIHTWTHATKESSPRKSNISNKMKDSHKNPYYLEREQIPMKDDVTYIVYYGALTPFIKSVKKLCLTSSLLGLAAQPFIWNGVSLVQDVTSYIIICSYVSFTTFINPFLLHILSKKYVTRVDYKKESDMYTAYTMDFFCKSRGIQFKAQDVKLPKTPRMFTSVLVRGQGFFLNPGSFIDPEHEHKLMGAEKT